jgi:MFS family permease
VSGEPEVVAYRRVAACVALGGMLVPLNSTMVVVAIPSLIDDLDVSFAVTTWLVTSYLVAMAVLQPLGGRLGDQLGRRPLILAGLAWFALASIGAAVSGSLAVLVLFRVQQAAAGALVFPNGIALLRELVSPDRLGAHLGTVWAVLPLGAAAGPPLAGLVIGLLDWRAVFLVNVPLVAAALALGSRALPRPTRSAAGIPRPHAAILRSRPFVAAASAVALSNLALYVTILALPILLTRRGGWTSTEIGLALGTISLGAFAFSPVGGRLADRLGRRIPSTCGLVLLAAGLVPLALRPREIAAAPLVATLVAVGLGVGLATPALQVSALEAVGVSIAGAASGVVAASRYVGGIVGTLLLAGPLAPADVGTDGFGLIFAVPVAAASAALLLAVGLTGRTTLATEPSRPVLAP